MPFFLAEIIPQTDVEPLLQLVQTSRLSNGGGTAISRYEKGSELGRPQTYCALSFGIQLPLVTSYIDDAACVGEFRTILL
jgi:hypothetical protein